MEKRTTTLVIKTTRNGSVALDLLLWDVVDCFIFMFFHFLHNLCMVFIISSLLLALVKAASLIRWIITAKFLRTKVSPGSKGIEI